MLVLAEKRKWARIYKMRRGSAKRPKQITKGPSSWLGHEAFCELQEIFAPQLMGIVGPNSVAQPNPTSGL